MQFRLTEAALETIEADVAIGFVYEGEGGQIPAIRVWDSLTGGLASEMAERGEFRGKYQSVAVVHRPAGVRAGRVLLAGCGSPGKVSLSRWRDCAGSAWRQLRTTGARSVAVLIPYGAEADTGVRAVVEGIALADYEPDIHKSSDRKASCLESVTISARGASQAALDRAVATAEAQNQARELVNEPGEPASSRRACQTRLRARRERRAGLRGPRRRENAFVGDGEPFWVSPKEALTNRSWSSCDTVRSAFLRRAAHTSAWSERR